MKYYLNGNSGFNTAEREREIFKIYKNRMHQFAKYDVLDDKDGLECLKLIAESQLEVEEKENTLSEKPKKKSFSKIIFDFKKQCIKIIGCDSIDLNLKIETDGGCL